MLRPGSQIGGVRIEELLGRGAMGEVWRAVQISLKRPVAVKRIAAHLLDKPEAVARFTREAQCVATVQSPHVVAVHDFGRFADAEGEEHWLLVMELVDGGASLRGLLGQPLAWAAASSLAMQAAEGLAAAAELGVVHRDIKPDNIMLTRKGVAKLADFGLAKSIDSSAVTMAGSLLGTPLYMAPEACRGAEIDGRGDLYSLGVTWFQLLAGRPPFQAASTVALLRCHLDDAPPPLLDLAPGTPPAVAALVMRCLAKDPAARPASARALADAIAALGAQGLDIPRTVPGLVGAGQGVQQGSSVPTSLMTPAEAATVTTAPAAPDPLAATVATAAMAPATSARPAQPPAAAPATIAQPTPRQAAAPATMASGSAVSAAAAPATAPVPAPRGRLQLAVALAVVVAVAAMTGLALSGRVAGGALAAGRAQVDGAIAARDFGLALTRADALLAAHPGDRAALEAVQAAVFAEVADLASQERFDEAVALLVLRRGERSWLAIDLAERDLRLAQAAGQVRAKRLDDALATYGALRQRLPKDLTVCRAMVANLIDSDHPDAALGAALTLAEADDAPLDALLEGKVSALLIGALADHGPAGDFVERLRATLIRRHPPVIAAMRAVLLDEDYELRVNAYRLLLEAGQLGEDEALRHQLLNVVSLSSSYVVAREAVEWLRAAAARPGWVERKRAAGLQPITRVLALASADEHQRAVSELLVGAFLPEIQDALVAWLAADDADLRHNAFTMLHAAGLAGRIDIPAFHARTLAISHPLYERPEFAAALAWCRSQSGTAGAAAAREALQAGLAHIGAEIAKYERAGMASRAATCRQRLQQVQETLDAVR